MSRGLCRAGVVENEGKRMGRCRTGVRRSQGLEAFREGFEWVVCHYEGGVSCDCPGLGVKGGDERGGHDEVIMDIICAVFGSVGD